MNTEYEVNYKGWSLEVVKLPGRYWRVFTQNQYVADGESMDQASKNAEACIDRNFE